MNSSNIFFSLLRYAIGTGSDVPSLSLADIKKSLAVARKQSLVGIFFSALNKSGVKPTDIDGHEEEYEDMVMELMGEKVKTVRLNDKLNKDVIGVTEWLDDNGFETSLLKGQGNALLYPDPSIRTAGDIDLWTRTKEYADIESDIRAVIAFSHKNAKHKGNAIYQHIDGIEWNGTEVEMHYRPQFMQNLFYNARLQRFFFDNANEQFAHLVKIGGCDVAVPTHEFNIVFQISHIYQHLFKEGIGLRQVLDYFYLLKAYYKSENKKPVDWERTFRHLGLRNIASAISWILIKEFGMSSEWAVVAPDERRGRFVLGEIMTGGNFGKYDERNTRFGNGKIGKNFERLIRDLRLVRYFPSEALGEPVFRLYHAWWRWRHN